MPKIDLSHPGSSSRSSHEVKEGQLAATLSKILALRFRVSVKAHSSADGWVVHVSFTKKQDQLGYKQAEAILAGQWTSPGLDD